MNNILFYIANFIAGLLAILAGARAAKIRDIKQDNQRLKEENIRLEKLLNL